MDKTIHAVRQRAAELDRRLAEWEIAGKAMREEREELRVYERVYARFADGDEPAIEASEPDLAARMVVPEEPTVEFGRATTSKPAEAPTVPEMIFEALAAADMIGKAGLLPKEITAYIRQKWWPDAPSDSIGPIVWRMWAKDNRLDKIGDLYSLKPDPASGQLFQDRADAPEQQEAAPV